MANDFDLPPIYDPLVKSNQKISDTWSNWQSSFVQNLINYLSSIGIFIPRISTDDRNNIKSPQNGQMIYNTTSNEFQGFANGVWKVFTLV